MKLLKSSPNRTYSFNIETLPKLNYVKLESVPSCKIFKGGFGARTKYYLENVNKQKIKNM